MGAVRDKIYEGPKDVGAFFEKVYDETKRKYKFKLVGGHGLIVIGFEDGKVDDIMDENHLDLSDIGLLNPVKDQGKAENCYAQVACLTAEYEYKKETGQDFVSSAQDVHENLIESEAQDANGRSIKDAFIWMKYNVCVSQDSCPYRTTWQRLDNPPPREVIFSL
ncbi:cathepsin B [Trifolium repens]|nr:cathepsin B [Trifolium repens]